MHGREIVLNRAGILPVGDGFLRTFLVILPVAQVITGLRIQRVCCNGTFQHEQIEQAVREAVIRRSGLAGFPV
ncbi:hypothetical protein D3C75_1086170 [compost metagenome]